MPKRLEVAGVTFDREQFEGPHPLSLRAEMRRDGQWAREQLQARDRAEIALPLELPIWVTKTPLTEGKACSCRPSAGICLCFIVALPTVQKTVVFWTGLQGFAFSWTGIPKTVKITVNFSMFRHCQ
ncbi:hypothetical protein AAIG78_005267 [Escherichia coli]|nr:hypothetical protein [Escherichia coli]